MDTSTQGLIDMVRSAYPAIELDLVDKISDPTAIPLTVKAAALNFAVKTALKQVEKEVVTAATKFKPFNSAHEGYGVLLEEVDELWDEVKKNQKIRDQAKLRQEAIQVAAMAVRFLIDVCYSENNT